MRRVVAILMLSACLASVPTLADDMYFVPTPIAPSPVVSYYSAPVVYGAPVYAQTPVYYSSHSVVYHPAYVVPTRTVAVTTYPPSTVVYGHHGFAPVVPTYTTGYYAPRTVYRTHGYVHGPFWGGLPYGVDKVEIEYKRRRDGGFKLEVDYDD